MNTTVENEFGAKVSTIEHLMGALFGLGIDNALIEIDNEEVPIMDGSAKIFIEKILSVGLATSDCPIKIIKINEEIIYITNFLPFYFSCSSEKKEEVKQEPIIYKYGYDQSKYVFEVFFHMIYFITDPQFLKEHLKNYFLKKLFTC